MKNINPSIDQFEKFTNPGLESEPSDFVRLTGENRLRSLARTIPSYGHQQLVATTQACISATIHATQEYLTQLVAGLTLTNPFAATMMIVSSSGLDVSDWLIRTGDSHGWMPDNPVCGYVTMGRLAHQPIYGMSAFEPAITLGVNCSGDAQLNDFSVMFSVADAEDMRLLARFLENSSKTWDEFENIFGVTPFTSVPLPDDIEDELGSEANCREYALAFVKHVVAKHIEDGNSCLETFDLEFSVKKNAPLHEPLVAAIGLLTAFSVFKYSKQKGKNAKSRSIYLAELSSAIATGRANKHLHESEHTSTPD